MPTPPCYAFSCPSTDVSVEKIKRTAQCERCTCRIEIGSLIAVEAMTGRVDLDLDLRALRGTQGSGMLGRCDWVAFTEMHEYRATWFLRDIRCNLCRVIAHGACNTVELCSASPRDRAAPTIAERRHFA